MSTDTNARLARVRSLIQDHRRLEARVVAGRCLVTQDYLRHHNIDPLNPPDALRCLVDHLDSAEALRFAPWSRAGRLMWDVLRGAHEGVTGVELRQTLEARADAIDPRHPEMNRVDVRAELLAASLWWMGYASFRLGIGSSADAATLDTDGAARLAAREAAALDARRAVIAALGGDPALEPYAQAIERDATGGDAPHHFDDVRPDEVDLSRLTTCRERDPVTAIVSHHLDLAVYHGPPGVVVAPHPEGGDAWTYSRWHAAVFAAGPDLYLDASALEVAGRPLRRHVRMYRSGFTEKGAPPPGYLHEHDPDIHPTTLGLGPTADGCRAAARYALGLYEAQGARQTSIFGEAA